MTEEKTVEEIIEVQEDTNIDEEKKWCVYMHTSPSGKKYIGITGESNPVRRWGTNGNKYKSIKSNGRFSQPVMANALNKYPDWDEWTHEILFSGLTKLEAEEKEIELIAKYNLRDSNYGYNIQPGGNVTAGKDNPFYGRRHTEETKAKMRANHADIFGENNPFYGKHHTQDTKDKISDALRDKYTGVNSHKYGTHPTEETRKKMSEAKKGKVASKETKIKMSEQRSGFKNSAAKHPVYCIQLDEIFWGAMEAKNKYRFNDNLIRRSIKTNKTYAGKHPETNEPLYWKYVYDQTQNDGTIIQGAITLGYITEEQVNEYLNSLKEKENDK